MEQFFSKKDLLAAIGIFVLALMIRLPFFSYPSTTVFDEGAYITYISNTLKHEAFFEPHPPLAWYFFSLLAPAGSHFDWEKSNKLPGNPFGEFPFERMRLANIVLGSLLAAVVFFLGRLLGLDRKKALIPALLVSLDSALIVQSRFILPDTIFLLLGFFGVSSLLANKLFKGWPRNTALIAGGLLIGLACSIKWTGLGFLGAAFVFFIADRKWKDILKIILAAVFAYMSIFFLYFASFEKGPVELSRGYYSGSYLSGMVIPVKGDLIGYSKLFVNYNKAIYLTHSDKEAMNKIINLGGAEQWPLSLSPIWFWTNTDKTKNIISNGNYFSWAIVLIAVIYFSFTSLKNIYKDKEIKSKVKIFLVIGYFVNYLPFFFIGRQMFLYHYFTALIFGYLLIPYLLEDVFDKEKSKKCLPLKPEILLLAGSIAVFIALAGTTYGF